MRPEELHIVRIKRELDAMLKNNALNKKRLTDLLESLTGLDVNTELLQRTRIGHTVNNVRKTFASSKDINAKAAKVIKQWKIVVKNEHARVQETRKSSDGGGGPDAPSHIIILDDDDPKIEGDISIPATAIGDHAYLPSYVSRSSSGENEGDTGEGDRKNLRSDSVSSDSSEATYSSDLNHSGRTIDMPSNKMRCKSVELLRRALLSGDEKPPRTASKTSLELAIEIERHIFDEFENVEDRRYKARVRSRIMNLSDKKNTAFRHDVLAGRIPTKRVAAMSADEMANDELKQLRKSIEEESIREHEMPPDSASSRTCEYQCEQCGKRDACYSVAQEKVDGDYEPVAVTQLVCNKCGHRWRLF